MDENIAIRITGLSKKYSISEKKTGLSFAGRLKELFRLSRHKKVQKSNDFYALKDINLEIKKGESVGIIGRNGAGKSTLLKTLAEVVEPTEGTIEINGTVASVLEVGMGFHPELSGRENVFLSGAMLGISKKKIAEKFDEIVDFAGVGKFIDTPVKHYSSGMYVRLAFSVVANIDADILLFDEVLNVGDLAFQLKCSEKIKELFEQKKTVLLVSHNMNDIQHLCREVIYMSQGKIVEFGSIDLIKVYYEGSLNDTRLINSDIVEIDESNKVFSNISFKELNEGVPLGDQCVVVKKLYVYNETLSSSIDFFTNNEISINLEYEILKQGIFYDFGFTVSTMNNIFMGIHTLISDIDITDGLKQGKHSLKVYLPKDFLNDTVFIIGYSITKENKEIVCYDTNLLKIKISRQLNNKNREYFLKFNSFFGPLRPKFKWEVK